MTRPHKSKEKQQKKVAEKIESLFNIAQDVFSHNKPLANRQVKMARKIAMRVKARIPLQFKRRFCKYCYSYLQPGVNARVRTHKGKVIISCFECKKFTRIPLGKK